MLRQQELEANTNNASGSNIAGYQAQNTNNYDQDDDIYGDQQYPLGPAGTLQVLLLLLALLLAPLLLLHTEEEIEVPQLEETEVLELGETEVLLLEETEEL